MTSDLHETIDVDEQDDEDRLESLKDLPHSWTIVGLDEKEYWKRIEGKNSIELDEQMK